MSIVNDEGQIPIEPRHEVAAVVEGASAGLTLGRASPGEAREQSVSLGHGGNIAARRAGAGKPASPAISLDALIVPSILENLKGTERG